jgi:hypothetical protein
MPHAQALVIACDPSRVAADLMARLRHETEWAAEAGFVKLAEGTCSFYAWPEGLRLDAVAQSGEDLTRVEAFIREQLEANGVTCVEWRRRPLSEIPR